jgi:hypothetical protein
MQEVRADVHHDVLAAFEYEIRWRLFAMLLPGHEEPWFTRAYEGVIEEVGWKRRLLDEPLEALAWLTDDPANVAE